jgi:hypothetical protein
MKKKDDLNEVKSLLGKLDSQVLCIALAELETDRKEIAEIKKFLKNKKPDSVHKAFLELYFTVESSEVDKTLDKIRDYDLNILKTAVNELGIIQRNGLCAEDVHCYGRAIWVMYCGSSLRTYINPAELVINPEIQYKINPKGGGVIIDG